MSSNDSRPSRISLLWNNVPLIIIGVFFLILGVAVIGYYVDHRVRNIEQQLKLRPPRNYEPPDLTQYAVQPETSQTLTSSGTIYVPAYSHIYNQGGASFPLETTLSIRNVNPEKPTFIESVKYFDTDGTLDKMFIDQLIQLKPLQTIDFLVERHDSSGGSGANFLVRWKGGDPSCRPLAETIMIGSEVGRSFSFTGKGIDVSDGLNTTN